MENSTSVHDDNSPKYNDNNEDNGATIMITISRYSGHTAGVLFSWVRVIVCTRHITVRRGSHVSAAVTVSGGARVVTTIFLSPQGQYRLGGYSDESFHTPVRIRRRRLRKYKFCPATFSENFRYRFSGLVQRRR